MCPRARTLAAATATSLEWYSSLNALAFRPLVTHLVPALLSVTEKIVGFFTIYAIEARVLVLWMFQKAQPQKRRPAGCACRGSGTAAGPFTTAHSPRSR
jgi:hypothetical protein